MNKLEVKNNWGRLTYFFRGERIDETQDGEVLLTTGERVRYLSRSRRVTVGDHGGSYDVIQRYLAAQIEYNGQAIEVDLDTLDIEEFIQLPPEPTEEPSRKALPNSAKMNRTRQERVQYVVTMLARNAQRMHKSEHKVGVIDAKQAYRYSLGVRYTRAEARTYQSAEHGDTLAIQNHATLAFAPNSLNENSKTKARASANTL